MRRNTSTAFVQARFRPAPHEALIYGALCRHVAAHAAYPLPELLGVGVWAGGAALSFRYASYDSDTH